MWQHGFLILLALICCNAENGLDLSKVCRNARPGDVLPNPLDCASYFICSDALLATLNQCGVGLHYDAQRKVCNWPALANCKFGVTVFPLFTDTTAGASDQKPPTVDSSTNTTPEPAGGWNDMRLTFAAFSVATGQIVNPMYGYDPQQIQCIHRGAYFLPHPRTCQRYFMCAFGHLLPHECGRGTVWSYKRQQCEIATDPSAECYNEAQNAEKSTTGKPTTAVTSPWPENVPTVCYPIYTTGTSGGTTVTWHPTGTTFHPTGTTWNPTGTTWNPTGTTWIPTVTTPKPLTSTGTPAATPRTTPTPAKNSDDAQLNCSVGIKYLPDARNCAHYYICIKDIPVGMFCPEGSFWDYEGEFCTSQAKGECMRKK